MYELSTHNKTHSCTCKIILHKHTCIHVHQTFLYVQSSTFMCILYMIDKQQNLIHSSSKSCEVCHKKGEISEFIAYTDANLLVFKHIFYKSE